MSKLSGVSDRTFSSLKVRNYRIYFIGQMISMCGTWMQTVGQAWLVLKLTGSGTALGLVTALQFLPVLLLGPFAGVVVDRMPKRRVLRITQTTAAVMAFLLAVLVSTGTVRLWHVYAGYRVRPGGDLRHPDPADLRSGAGRQGRLEQRRDLNAVMVNTARAIGPAGRRADRHLRAGGVFYINAASFLAAGGVGDNRRAEAHRHGADGGSKGQLRKACATCDPPGACATPWS